MVLPFNIYKSIWLCSGSPCVDNTLYLVFLTLILLVKLRVRGKLKGVTTNQNFAEPFLVLKLPQDELQLLD